MDEHAAWPMISRLPVLLAVSIPLTGFTVRALLELSAGQSITTEWQATHDVPLKAGAVQVAWGEFEVVAQSIALRLTRLT
jgi:flagellar motor switch protein FliM